MFSLFEKYPRLLAALSTKKDGSLDLRSTGKPEVDEIINKNRRRFITLLGIGETSSISANLVHGNAIQKVGREENGTIIKSVDGLITDERGVFLSITVADCLPIFLYDKERGVIGIVHGGWRGLSREIAEIVVQELINKFGTKTEDIIVGIGPGISQCHFEVKDDVLDNFKEYLPDVIATKSGKTFLDLKKTAKIQLMKSGIKDKNIEISPECTYCLQEKYFSYRRDKPEIIETMMAVIGIKD